MNAICDLVKKKYDAAHPLQIDRNVIKDFLSSNFKTVYKRIQPNSQNLEGEKINWKDLYFIGKKK